jgi:O-antigen ligase
MRGRIVRWIPEGDCCSISLALYLLGTILLGELALRPAFGITLSDLFFLLALLALVVELLIKRRVPTLGLPPLTMVGGVLFTVGGLVSSALSRDRLASVDALVRIDYVIMVWLWLGTQIVTTARQLELVTRLWGISAAVTSLAGLIQLLLPGVVPDTGSSGGRIAGLTQDVSDLGGITSIALIPCLMFAASPRTARWSRLLAVSIAALVLTGLILSGSVSGFLAAVCGLSVWIVIGRPGRRVVFALCALAFMALIVVLLQTIRNGATPAARLASVFGQGPDKRGFVTTFQTRLDSDRAALSVIWHHPLIGIGLDNNSYLHAIGTLVHNIFLEAWLGGGFLAFLGLLLVVAGIAYAGLGQLRSPAESRSMAAALLASFIAFCVFAMTAPALLSRYAWMPAGLILILIGIQRDGSMSSSSIKHLSE